MVKPTIALLLVFCCCAILKAPAQDTLGLLRCQEKAREHYPLLRQHELLKQMSELNREKLSTNFLPVPVLQGQFTHQSEVTTVKIPIPNFNVQPVSKDQYRVTLEVAQLLFDGGLTRALKQNEVLNLQVEQQKTEVELFKLKERVNQLFFSALLMQQQVALLENGISEINSKIAQLENLKKFGTATSYNINHLKVEVLRMENNIIEAEAQRKTALQNLAWITGLSISENSRLLMPAADVKDNVNRPELKLFEAQMQQIAQQNKALSARLRPGFQAFTQTGYGRPGLNMLNNKADFFYIAGIRGSWSLGQFYVVRKNRQQLSLQQQMVEVQKNSFLFNLQLQQNQALGTIEKYRQLLVKDKQQVSLRQEIKNTASVQLDNGILSAKDYNSEVNALTQAQLNQQLHELLLVFEQINYQTINGN